MYGGDGRGKDEVEDVSAANELVAGDGGVGKENCDYAEDARGLVVARFQQVGDGVLGEAACARRDEVDERQTNPATGRLPQGREAVAIGVLRASKQRAGSDPTGEQGEDEDEGGKRAAGDQVVCAGMHLAQARKRDGEQCDDDDGERDGV